MKFSAFLNDHFSFQKKIRFHNTLRHVKRTFKACPSGLCLSENFLGVLEMGQSRHKALQTLQDAETMAMKIHPSLQELRLLLHATNHKLFEAYGEFTITAWKYGPRVECAFVGDLKKDSWSLLWPVGPCKSPGAPVVSKPLSFTCQPQRTEG